MPLRPKTGLAEADPAVTTPCGFDIVPTLSTRHQWFPCGPLLACHLTWFFPGLFPSVLTTMAFDHSRRRWFGTCSCKPVPRGLPSSVKQLRTPTACWLRLCSWHTIVGISDKCRCRGYKVKGTVTTQVN